MINFKSVIKFIVLFFVAYIVLLIPQTGINKVYRDFFCVTGNKLFHHFPNQGTTILKVQPSTDKSYVLVESKPKVKPSEKTYIRKFTIDTYLTGFLHTVFFISLVIATQIRLKKKIIALIAGFVIITCFVMLKVRIMMLYVDASAEIAGMTNPPLINPFLFWYKYFAEPMTPGYSFAIILWLCVSVGKKEWLQLNGIINEMAADKTPNQKKHIYQTSIDRSKLKQKRISPNLKNAKFINSSS